MKVYDPSSVVCLFNGLPVSGFASGTFITAEQNEEAFKLYVGVSGESTRGLTNNRSGRVTISLQQTSSFNDIFSAVHSADVSAPSGVGVSSMQIKDINGGTLLLANRCWIVSSPEVVFSSSIEPRRWVFETGAMSLAVGGSNSVGV